MQINVAADGRVLSVNNSLFPDLGISVNTTVPILRATEAVDIGAAYVGGPLDEPPRELEPADGVDQRTVVDETGVSLSPIVAKLVLVPIRQGDARLAWNFQVDMLDRQHAYNLTVDAVDGTVLTRFDLLIFDDYKVYPLPVEGPDRASPPAHVDPTVDARVIEEDPADPDASPLGWHDTDGTERPEFTTPQGNNTHVFVDLTGLGGPSSTEPNCGLPPSCDFPVDLTKLPSAYADASAVNAFYWINLCHDVFYRYGFDAEAGSFETNNYGLGGIGGDAINVEIQTPVRYARGASWRSQPDGEQPTMLLGTCDRSYDDSSTPFAPPRDAALDNSVVVHEYGHGVTTRLLGGPSTVLCTLNCEQPGEGISDFFALAFTHREGDRGTDSRGMAPYFFGQLPDGPGIRDQPYSTDPEVNDWTYESVNDCPCRRLTVPLPCTCSPDPHCVGQVFAQALWEVYWTVVDKWGFDPDLHNVEGGSGNQRMLLYVTEGLKNTICNPTFPEVRDGIIQASLLSYEAVDFCRIWSAFASFGLGTDARNNGRFPIELNARNGFQTPGGCRGQFVRGDCNFDGAINVSDPLFCLNGLFRGGPDPLCEDEGDVNDDGAVDIADASFTFGWLFLGGPVPRFPAPEPGAAYDPELSCGVDPTVDSLTCNGFPPCP